MNRDSPEQGWNVLPHDGFVELDEGLWRIEGALPGMPLRRCMVVARRSDGRLVIHNGIALESELMTKLEGWGEPAFLVVPNGWHRLDAAAYKRRYPNITVLCPRGARRRVEKLVAVDGNYDDYPPDPRVALAHFPGIADAEGMMRVQSAGGLTLVFNDLLFNLPHQPGLFGLVYRLTGSTGGPRITRVGRWFMVKDEHAVRSALERLAAEPNLARIVFGHGAPIDSEPAATLRAIAAAL